MVPSLKVKVEHDLMALPNQVQIHQFFKKNMFNHLWRLVTCWVREELQG